jgi:hypothetical protein
MAKTSTSTEQPAMEFSNHTPFPALAFESVMPDGAAFHTVVLRQTFELRDGSLVLAQAQKPLATSDRFHDEPNQSSVTEESDLAPYKPLCDVVIVGTAHAPSGRAVPRFAVRARIIGSSAASGQTGPSAPQVLLDRRLAITGPRELVRRSGLVRRASQLMTLCTLGLVRLPAWKLTSPEPIAELPVRYEYAWGGQCLVSADDPAAKRVPKEFLLNGQQPDVHSDQSESPAAHTVCEDNPIGAGFTEPWFMKAVKQERIRAPQIEPDSAPVTAQAWIDTLQGQPSPALRPAGFGVVGKAWSPRRALAGTYDEQWLAERHPGLPDDFQFSYWNGAPEEMQTPHLKGDEAILLTNLLPAGAPGTESDAEGNTLLRIQLPGHLPMGWAYTDQALKFAALLLDTLSIDLSDATKPAVTLVWRATFLRVAGIRRFEARFIERSDINRVSALPETGVGIDLGAANG